MKKSNMKNWFGEDKQVSFRSMALQIPILPNKVITERIDDDHDNVSILIVLDLLDKYGLHFNNVKTVLCYPKLNIVFHLLRKHGHIYLL